MRSYVSTRGALPVPLDVALERGLAPDGGLYVPTEIGSFQASAPKAGGSFRDSALWAAPALFPEVESGVLGAVARDAFWFEVPLVEVEPDTYVLELFHGPTHAFKDVGARFMARLMAAVLPDDRERTVLVATSGDTGGAVAAAFHDVPGYRVVVLFPRDGVSERQRRQMTTLGRNVLPLAVTGTFDDCQRLAKEAFVDPELSTRLGLTSANSINIGRLLPQALYYVHAALQLGWSGREARFVVPSGNLGNLCAGLLAQRHGMPASGFVAATNVNDGFVRFLETGQLEARPAVPTASNAMDVGAPSNLERIRWLFRDDLAALSRNVGGVRVSDATTAQTIKSVYERTGYLLDPHSAVGYHAAAGQRNGPKPSAPAVVLATAHPAKFPQIVKAETGREIPLPTGLERALGAEESFEVVAADLDQVVAAIDSTRNETSSGRGVGA